MSDHEKKSSHHPSLQILESEAGCLETVLDASHCQAQERIAASRRHRNTLVPFHSLLTELVGDIFHLSFYESPTSKISLENLRNLASVSYAWWKIVKTHPQLWTFVNLSRPESVSLMLRRSGNLPISIEWHEGRQSEGAWPPLLEAVKLVCAHTRRWKSLDIDSRRVGMWEEALVLPLPLLETLALDIRRGRTHDLTTFVGGPRLSKLKLTKILPPIDIQTFVNLETLHLDTVHNLLQADYLLSILQVVERLEELRLSHINITSVEGGNVQVLEEPIILTTLANLALIDCSSQTIVTLMSSISCPKLEVLTISYDGNQVDVRSVFWHLFHTPGGLSLWTTVSNRRAELSERIVNSYDYRTTLGIHGGGFSVTIAGHGVDSLLRVLSGLPAFPFHHITSAPIHLTLGNQSEVDLIAPGECQVLLRMLPDVTSVTLFGDYELTLRVIARLERSQETENGTAWSLPRLEVLKVYCHASDLPRAQFMRAVRNMVQARRASVGLVRLIVEIRDWKEVMLGIEDGT